jgi:hypothetical protein
MSRQMLGFLAETELAASLENPNVVRIHDDQARTASG